MGLNLNMLGQIQVLYILGYRSHLELRIYSPIILQGTVLNQTGNFTFTSNYMLDCQSTILAGVRIVSLPQCKNGLCIPPSLLPSGF
jgi:hypothetical protein